MTEQITHQESTRRMLHEIGFPVHQNGYRRLCVAIPRFAQDPEQSVTKELYPYVAKVFGDKDAGDVESSIRRTILFAWKNGNKEAWQKYFPGATKAPSNLVFIATLAEYLT